MNAGHGGFGALEDDVLHLLHVDVGGADDIQHAG